MLRGLIIFFSLIGSFYAFAKDTELKLYRPFINQTELQIRKNQPGECWQQSQRIKREDAWRCQAEEKIFDPCFIKPSTHEKELFCPDSPWVKNGLMINLASPLNNSQHRSLDLSEAFPWAVELKSGEKCEAVDEGQVYDGLQVHYRCNNQSLLLGHVQRCDAQWSILQHSPKGVETAIIAKAWF
ncbi:MAG: hypothetical protein H0U70_09170 [Tatlockia sp.]|nr:hypothetical protein [Tatlockia sp.]